MNLLLDLLENKVVQQAIRLLVFAGFFAFTATCIFLLNRIDCSRREKVRKVFVLALVVGMTVPTITGVMFPPFAAWGFFTDPAPESATQYSVVVVTESGEEFDYPAEAAPPGRIHHRAGLIATNETKVPPDQMAEFLLTRAESHRKATARERSITERLSYGHVRNVIRDDYAWSSDEAEKMGQFREIRIYRTSLNTSPDGLRITGRHTELAYSYNLGTEQEVKK